MGPLDGGASALLYIEVNISSPIPVYRQIMDQIRAFVTRGALAPGQALPSVRQLATELGVNPNTVAKAYQLLELEGTIVTVRRRGAFVGEGSAAQAAQAHKKRVAQIVGGLLEEARRLGLSRKEIMDALSETEDPSSASEGGGER